MGILVPSGCDTTADEEDFRLRSTAMVRSLTRSPVTEFLIDFVLSDTLLRERMVLFARLVDSGPVCLLEECSSYTTAKATSIPPIVRV